MAVKFEYMYRDEGNLKISCEQWFEGDLTLELKARLEAAMKETR